MPEVKTTEEIYTKAANSIEKNHAHNWQMEWVRKEDYDALESIKNHGCGHITYGKEKFPTLLHLIKHIEDKTKRQFISSLRAEIEKIPCNNRSRRNVKDEILSLLDGVKE